MSFDVKTKLAFNRDYFLYGIEPQVENIDDQLLRLHKENLLRKIDDQFAPPIEEFRRFYAMRDLRDSNGNTLLHKLVTHNRHIKYFKEALKDQNLNINAKNSDGDTAYHLAARLKDSKYAQELGKLNAPSDIPNNRGITVKQMMGW